ncbi:hypothetical protein CRG98_041285 [Punica granatum]|uniref:ATPase AAA-type core domain-containing protein n=1 Tax=Punica granatum TaxID=22663 RepID=A0A2I0I316_PUNGR|nr:hypothetical protein CRG98_041285 [Punica granatum]
MKVRNQQRRLYTNNGSFWSHVVFEHPATFQTLVMEPERKKEIMDDLIEFSQVEDFYARTSRAWKRGYLLYGPAGTGKSLMIAAMANLLGYDPYDLELMAVKDNTELRKLLIETSSKSIIVIEDIDCSLDLTGQTKEKSKEENEDEKNPMKKLAVDDRETKPSNVTLSGLLNFIDGLCHPWLLAQMVPARGFIFFLGVVSTGLYLLIVYGAASGPWQRNIVIIFSFGFRIERSQRELKGCLAAEGWHLWGGFSSGHGFHRAEQP